MSCADQPCCAECGGELRTCDMKSGRKSCLSCAQRRRLVRFTSEAYIDHAFSSTWAKELFKQLCTFLGEREVPIGTQVPMLPKAALFFQATEQSFLRAEDLSQEWIEGRIAQVGPRLCPTFFRAFLVEAHLTSETDQDEKRIKALQTKIESLPRGYQRLMEVYFNERLAVRERQIKLKARRPLALLTIESDFEGFFRLIRWLTEHIPHLTGWAMVQEEHINTFLLTLPLKTREIVRKDLFVLFRLARKRRVMTHVPVMDLPSRELPRTVEPLQVEEQKTVARLIRASIYTHPEEALLTALCFYHGLSSSQISHIKTSDVDVERGMIHMEGRPPVYLLAEDFVLLEQFLIKRKALPYANRRSYLFISNQRRLDDRPLRKDYAGRKVPAFTGHTPQRLWISCFAALSARYGPQYLVEAFGVSLTHASRYGKIEEFLLEEEVKEQREAFLELSRQLEGNAKQHTPRSRSKKAEVKHDDTVQH